MHIFCTPYKAHHRIFGHLPIMVQVKLIVSHEENVHKSGIFP